jgi:hypothetical protein
LSALDRLGVGQVTNRARSDVGAVSGPSPPNFEPTARLGGIDRPAGSQQLDGAGSSEPAGGVEEGVAVALGIGGGREQALEGDGPTDRHGAERLEDRVFGSPIPRGGPRAAAPVGAVADSVPVALPLAAPRDRAAAAGAGLGRGGAHAVR